MEPVFKFLFVEFTRNAPYLARKEDELSLARGDLGRIAASGEFCAGPALPAEWADSAALFLKSKDEYTNAYCGPETINGHTVYLYRADAGLTEPVPLDAILFDIDVMHIMDEDDFEEKWQQLFPPGFWWRGDVAYAHIRSLSSSYLGAKVKACVFSDNLRGRGPPVCVVIKGY